MNELTIFKNDTFGDIRTLNVDGEPWFVGKDVAEVLGYSNPQEAIRNHVDNEDKGVSEILTPGGKQRPIIINESGLYSLILSSKLPSAKDFKRWITHEVIPAIRKTGGYIAGEEHMNDDQLIAQALIVASRKLEARTAELAAANKSIDAMSPKADYYDKVLQNPGLTPITMIAQDYGYSAIAFNRLLHSLGILYRCGRRWVMYAEFADKPYTATKTHVHIGSDGMEHVTEQLEWTQAGRKWLYDVLKKEGILPVLEKQAAKGKKS